MVKTYICGYLSLTMSDYRQYITEAANLSDYLSDSDFEIIFYDMLRDFAFERNPNLSRRINMLYLMTNFLDSFIKHYNLDKNKTRYSPRGIPAIYGRELYNAGLYEISIYSPEKKFTEKFKKFLNFLIERMDIPKEINYTLTEEIPNYVEIRTSINYDDIVKKGTVNPEIFKYTSRSYSSPFHQLISQLKDFLNLKSGSPTEGGVQFNVHEMEYNGRQEWTQKFLKELRKFVKSNEFLKDKVKAIKLKENNYRMNLDIILNNPDQYTSWHSRSENRENIHNILNAIKDYIEGEGYSLSVFDIDSPTLRKYF